MLYLLTRNSLFFKSIRRAQASAPRLTPVMQKISAWFLQTLWLTFNKEMSGLVEVSMFQQNVGKWTKRKTGDGKKWKEKESIIYFFSVFSFSFFPRVTLVMSRILDRTWRKKRWSPYGEKQTWSLIRPLTGKRWRLGNIILGPLILFVGSLLFKTE